MLKRNISVYITDVTMVQLASQDLMSVLEKLGVNYSMNIETEEVEEKLEDRLAHAEAEFYRNNPKGKALVDDQIERDLAVRAREDAITKSVDESVGGGLFDKANLITQNVENPAIVRRGIPVMHPSSTAIGAVDRRIGTADLRNDGFAMVRLNEIGNDLFKYRDTLSISFNTLGPAKPAVPYNLAPGKKRDA